MRVLLHICCGPCATYCVEALRNEGYEVYGTFYNPNIHPYTEYQQRLESVEKFAEAAQLPLIGKPQYDMREFLRQVAFREHSRCQLCYYMRLKQTAAIARKGKFDAFTTTLLISPYQNRDMIVAIGEELARQNDIRFLAEDFRPGFKRSIELSKEHGLYRQQYCGCIYSEEERYRRKGKE